MKLSDFKQRVFILIGIVILSVLLILLDSVGFLTAFINIVSYTTIPVRIELKNFSTKVNDVIGAVSEISSLKGENGKLRQENFDLLARLSDLEEYKVENGNLKEQLKLREEIRDWILQARVLGTDIAYENVLQINVGNYNGVEKGDVVIYGDYAVGIITRVEKYSSKVTLITSTTSNIPVRGQTGRAGGLANGNVGSSLKMTDILPDEKIDIGEIIVTSGVNSQYPQGLIIGIVTNVESNPSNATYEAEIKVQLDFSKLDYIYIIKGQSI